MEAFAQFLENQEKIYQTIEALGRNTHDTGLVRDPYFGLYTGFFVNLTPSAEAASWAADLSQEIAKLFPSTSYTKDEVHTTLASLAKMEEGFRIDLELTEHCETLEKLERSAKSAVQELGREKPAIEYTRYIHSDKVVLATGLPNQAFVRLVNLIVGASKKEGVELRPAWGAHMTLARFTEAVPPEKLDPFYQLLKEAPVPGRSVPTEVNVGYNVWGWDKDNPHATHGGHLVAHCKIPLVT